MPTNKIKTIIEIIFIGALIAFVIGGAFFNRDNSKKDK
jgi:uncharacterized protein YneF (UPF0154 family)